MKVPELAIELASTSEEHPKKTDHVGQVECEEIVFPRPSSPREMGSTKRRSVPNAIISKTKWV